MVGAPGPASPVTPADAAAWYAAVAGNPLEWVVEHGGRCVGVARLHGVDEPSARGHLAVGLFAPADWGRGLGTEVVRLLLAHAFGAGRLAVVGLRVLSFNERALTCYRRCGFREVGREPVTLDGEAAEDILMECRPGAAPTAGPP
jgi:[ribosomal protein S5]-alanine N-acetyltransferase